MYDLKELNEQYIGRRICGWADCEEEAETGSLFCPSHTSHTIYLPVLAVWYEKPERRFPWLAIIGLSAVAWVAVVWLLSSILTWWASR